jgi:hypothetical protein
MKCFINSSKHEHAAYKVIRETPGAISAKGPTAFFAKTPQHENRRSHSYSQLETRRAPWELTCNLRNVHFSHLKNVQSKSTKAFLSLSRSLAAACARSKCIIRAASVFFGEQQFPPRRWLINYVEPHYHLLPLPGRSLLRILRAPRPISF